MATASITCNITNLDADDRRAAKLAITNENQYRGNENARIASINATIAAQNPPGTPLALLTILPLSTAAEIKSSYEIVLAKLIVPQHTMLVSQSTEQLANVAEFTALKPSYADATPAKRAAAIAAFNAAIV